MKYSRGFAIQACNPELTGAYSQEQETLSEAISTIFSFSTDNAILFWNDGYCPLCYKYEISHLTEPLMVLLKKIQQFGVGEETLIWGLDTFHARWRLTWNWDELEIVSEWATVRGPCLNRLNASPKVNTKRIDFLCEWRRPFANILSGLRRSGYTALQIPEMTDLENLVSSIPSDGILYRES